MADPRISCSVYERVPDGHESLLNIPARLQSTSPGSKSQEVVETIFLVAEVFRPIIPEYTLQASCRGWCISNKKKRTSSKGLFFGPPHTSGPIVAGRPAATPPHHDRAATSFSSGHHLEGELCDQLGQVGAGTAEKCCGG